MLSTRQFSTALVTATCLLSTSVSAEQPSDALYTSSLTEALVWMTSADAATEVLPASAPQTVLDTDNLGVVIADRDVFQSTPWSAAENFAPATAVAPLVTRLDPLNVNAVLDDRQGFDDLVKMPRPVGLETGFSKSIRLGVGFQYTDVEINYDVGGRAQDEYNLRLPGAVGYLNVRF